MYKYGKDILHSITSKISNRLIQPPQSHAENEDQNIKKNTERSATVIHDVIVDTVNSSTSDTTVVSATQTSIAPNATDGVLPSSSSSSSSTKSPASTLQSNSTPTTTTMSASTTTSTINSKNQNSTQKLRPIFTKPTRLKSIKYLGKKRSRPDGYKTPMLVVQSSNGNNSECENSLDQESSSSSYSSSTSSSHSNRHKKQKRAGVLGQSNSLFLEMIPQEVIETHVLSFLRNGNDFHSLQLTCKVLKDLSNKTDILKYVDLSGEAESGKGSILNFVDSPVVAVDRLYKFANAGNHQALYMIGMIAAYCHGDKIGVTILKQTARQGCLRSAYALGLILRDCNKTESEKYLNGAIDKGYLPACQELLSSQTVKEKFGDLGADVLKAYFDPIGLNRLLGRCYLHSNGVRGVATSHCWNPCCGRWALKATQSTDGRTPQLQSPSKCLPALSNHVEASLLRLIQKDLRDDDFDSEDIVEGNSDEDVMHLGGGSNICIETSGKRSFRVSRMKMCSSCRRAKYCSKLCQVYDWRSGRHKQECQYL